MNKENAWIDEVILRHKNQLKVLKDNNINFSNHNIISENRHLKNISNQTFNNNNFTKTFDFVFNNNEKKLEKKLSEKKEKIHKLKLEITNLKQENETLKNNLKNLQLKNKNDNNDNLKIIIENHQYKIKRLKI